MKIKSLPVASKNIKRCFAPLNFCMREKGKEKMSLTITVVYDIVKNNKVLRYIKVSNKICKNFESYYIISQVYEVLKKICDSYSVEIVQSLNEYLNTEGIEI